MIEDLIVINIYCTVLFVAARDKIGHQGERQTTSGNREAETRTTAAPPGAPYFGSPYAYLGTRKLLLIFT